MADLRPRELQADERETLMVLLQFQRDSVVRKASGIDDAAARRRLVPSSTTLFWLVRHLTYAELIWVVIRFAGERVELPDPDSGDGTIEWAIDQYEQTWRMVDALVAREPSLDTPCRNFERDPNVNLRWVLAHLLEETARHAGHADIIRELIDGSTGR
jgi:hypothetical protein